MKSILDPSFRYTKSVDTDIRKTFARIYREQRKQAESADRAKADPRSKIAPFTAGRRAAIR